MWREAIDRKTGRMYYYHSRTRETTWTRPCDEEMASQSRTRLVERNGPDSALVAPLVDAGEASGGAVKLLSTFRSIKAKFGQEFLSVVSAVNGLHQFKALLGGTLGDGPKAECVNMLVGGCDSDSAELICGAGIPAVLSETANFAVNEGATTAASVLGSSRPRRQLYAGSDTLWQAPITTREVIALVLQLWKPNAKSVHPQLLPQVQWEGLATSKGPGGDHQEDWDLHACLLFCAMQTGPCKDEMAPYVLIIRDKIKELVSRSPALSESSRSIRGQSDLPLPLTGADLSCMQRMLAQPESISLLSWYLTTVCQDFNEAERFICSGGLGVLQLLCLEKSPEVSQTTRKLIVSLLHKHQSLAVQLLESWSSLATDLPLGLFNCFPADLLRESPMGKGAADAVGVADTFLKVGSSSLPVHKAVLIARSPTLRDLILQRPEESFLSADGLVPESLVSTVLLFLYTGISLVPGTSDEALELVQVAHKLRMLSLVSSCERALKNLISLSNVQRVLAVAETCGLASLQACCHSFVRVGELHDDSMSDVLATSTDSAGLLSSALLEGSFDDGPHDVQHAVQQTTGVGTSKTMSTEHRPTHRRGGSRGSMNSDSHPSHGSMYRALLEEARDLGVAGDESEGPIPVDGSPITRRCAKSGHGETEVRDSMGMALPRPRASSCERSVPLPTPLEFVESLHSLRPPAAPNQDAHPPSQARAHSKATIGRLRTNYSERSNKATASERQRAPPQQYRQPSHREPTAADADVGAAAEGPATPAIIKDKLRLLKSGRLSRSIDTGRSARDAAYDSKTPSDRGERPARRSHEWRGQDDDGLNADDESSAAPLTHVSKRNVAGQQKQGPASRSRKSPNRRSQDKGASTEGKASKWKAESENFRATIRAARGGAGQDGAVPSGPDMSLMPCPHCGRRFNEKAAERHIPKCKNTVARPTRLIRGQGLTAASGARLAWKRGSQDGRSGKGSSPFH